MITKICAVCEKSFSVHNYRAIVQMACSDKCSRINRRGKKNRLTDYVVVFWSKVLRADPVSCRPYQGSYNSDGYGNFWIYREHIKAHRAAWTFTNGNIPKGLCVLHKCDNPPCCNPDHLFLGTDADNVKDKMTKGRHRAVAREDHPRAKITEDQVQQIRKTTLSQRQTAILFGLSKSQIARILHNKSWKDVTL